jgi:hypothetical protein
MNAVMGRRIHKRVAQAQLQREFRAGLLDWFRDMLVSSATISPEDLQLMLLCDGPEDIVKAIFSHYETRSLELSEAGQAILLEL